MFNAQNNLNSVIWRIFWFSQYFLVPIARSDLRRREFIPRRLYLPSTMFAQEADWFVRKMKM